MKRRVTFTEDGARRIAQTVRAHERGSRDQPPVKFDRVVGGDDPNPVRLGKTTSSWNKGTTASITIYENGVAPSETSSSITLDNCVNKFANVGAGKWVIVALCGNGYWYLISAECG